MGPEPAIELPWPGPSAVAPDVPREGQAWSSADPI